MTLIEVLAVFAVIVLFAMLILPAKNGSRRAPRLNCVNNLKQATLAFKLFASDHGDKFPMQVSTNEGGSMEWAGTKEVYRHFLTLSNELGHPKILHCPSDERRTNVSNFASFGPRNLSYWINLSAEETRGSNNVSWVLGDRNLVSNGVLLTNGCYLISTQQVLAWDGKTIHLDGGNICLSDGSSKQMSQTLLQADHLRQPKTTNWLAIP